MNYTDPTGHCFGCAQFRSEQGQTGYVCPQKQAQHGTGSAGSGVDAAARQSGQKNGGNKKNNKTDYAAPIWGGISNIERMWPRHEATVQFVRSQLLNLGQSPVTERVDTGIRGGGPNGGWGYPDVVSGGHVWEIKPDSGYGRLTGAAQIERYCREGNLTPGYALSGTAFAYGNGTINVRYGTGKDQGVVYYKYVPSIDPVAVKALDWVADQRKNDILNPSNWPSDPAPAAGNDFGFGFGTGIAGGAMAGSLPWWLLT